MKVRLFFCILALFSCQVSSAATVDLMPVAADSFDKAILKTQDEALGYCQKLGTRLPTMAEIAEFANEHGGFYVSPGRYQIKVNDVDLRPIFSTVNGNAKVTGYYSSDSYVSDRKFQRIEDGAFSSGTPFDLSEPAWIWTADKNFLFNDSPFSYGPSELYASEDYRSRFQSDRVIIHAGDIFAIDSLSNLKTGNRAPFRCINMKPRPNDVFLDSNNIAVDKDSNVFYMNSEKADDFCKSKGLRLPSREEYTDFAIAHGARGVAPTRFPKMPYTTKCENINRCKTGEFANICGKNQGDRGNGDIYWNEDFSNEQKIMSGNEFYVYLAGHEKCDGIDFVKYYYSKEGYVAPNDSFKNFFWTSSSYRPASPFKWIFQAGGPYAGNFSAGFSRGLDKTMRGVAVRCVR